MAWRPYENLIDGELDNRTPGRVTGWLRFFRQGKSPLKVRLDLAGDFHEDISGTVIRLKNDQPSDRSHQLNREDTYMRGFAAVQRGEAGDITAGLSLGPWTEALSQRLMAKIEALWKEHGISEQEREERRRELLAKHRQHIAAGDLYYSYVPYPYVEWYSEANGRVVLELDPSQVEIVHAAEARSRHEKTAAELAADERKRAAAFGAFMSGMVESIAKENRQRGGDGKVTGVVIR
jgi:hypothetical protein